MRVDRLMVLFSSLKLEGHYDAYRLSEGVLMPSDAVAFESPD